jgi:phage terminase Nu1 subunit (DNA packaging protein)
MPKITLPASKPPITVSLNSPLYVNSTGLAQAIRVSRRTVDNWRDRGLIPYVKVGGIVRFDLAKVRAVLEKRFEIRERK